MCFSLSMPSLSLSRSLSFPPFPPFRTFLPSFRRPLFLAHSIIPLSRRRGQQPSAPAFGRSPFVYTRFRFCLLPLARRAREFLSFERSTNFFLFFFVSCSLLTISLSADPIVLDPSREKLKNEHGSSKLMITEVAQRVKAFSEQVILLSSNDVLHDEMLIIDKEIGYQTYRENWTIFIIYQISIRSEKKIHFSQKT